MPWKFYQRHTNFEPDPSGDKTYITSITIEENTSLKRSLSNTSLSDESYTLSVQNDGSVLVNIIDPIGGVRALTTLTQLFYVHSVAGAGVYTPFAPVSIADSPSFEHRGLNLDISRNYIAPSDVIRTIDAMSVVKLNRLHLHAADAQSWPLEIPALPSLAAQGSYYNGLIYSVADLQNVQTYGAYRGIEVYVEIDTPGHTDAISWAYPDLITASNELDWSTYSAEPPSGQLELNSSAVTNFVTTLFNDLLPRVKPFDTYFHTGGDEINVNCYLVDPTVGSNVTAVIQPLLQDFVTQAHSIVRANGLSPIVWEELIVDWNLTLPTNDTIVQTWRSSAAIEEITSRGYKTLFGEYNYWYLDCGFGQWLDPIAGDPNTQIVPPYTDYCSPLKNWREIYSYDPLVNITDPAQRSLVIGGEVHMWGEQNDGDSLDNKVWPRAAAAAEVMWSGFVGPAGVNESVTRRLADVRERLVTMGVQPQPVQMTWCLQNLGRCEL